MNPVITITLKNIHATLQPRHTRVKFSGVATWWLSMQTDLGWLNLHCRILSDGEWKKNSVMNCTDEL